MRKILYIDDEPDNLFTLQINLQKWFDAITLEDPTKALDVIKEQDIKVVITDQRMPEMTGLEVSKEIQQNFPTVIVIILTAYDDNETILRAINQGGIFRYLIKPWDLNDLKQTLESAFTAHDLRKKNISLINDLLSKNRKLENAYQEINTLKDQLEEENIQLKDEFSENIISEEVVGKSILMKKVYSQIEQAAKSESSILLLGETGTGKELFAKAIHRLSSRKDNIMMKINCAAIPDTLIESELFGHEKGTFTGADKLKYGKFELAHNGTLFLDEIGELPINVQPKLLRVLQENEFERLGSNHTRKVDFRLVTATNRDIEKEVEKGNFRTDLYYRLNVLPVKLPALREHAEDIPLLVEHFVSKLNRKTGKTIEKIPKKVMDKLMAYNWPGNVRELENIIERAHVLSPGKKLEIENTYISLKNAVLTNKNIQSLEENERQHIINALKHTGWKIRGKGGAAEILKINPSTLESRMKKLDIKRPV